MLRQRALPRPLQIMSVNEGPPHDEEEKNEGQETADDIEGLSRPPRQLGDDEFHLDMTTCEYGS